MLDNKMLNIGCGATYHPDWINLDVSSADSSVLPIDINNGLPFDTGSIAVCYSSHLLEHLDKKSARYLLSECLRVLNRGGIVRLVVPDLELIAREYLRILDAITSGKMAKDSDYDWILLEMYDQTIRNFPGGEMAHFLVNLKVADRTFVQSRIGVEAEAFWVKQQIQAKKSWLNKLMRKETWWKLLTLSRQKLAGWLVFLIAGKAAFKSFQTGLFRNSGEVHQWMYDRYSMTRLLEQTGFVNVKLCAATESQIPEYGKYSLDVVNGQTRKPDSLYIEAVKP